MKSMVIHMAHVLLLEQTNTSLVFRAGAAVRNAVTDSAVVETIKEIKRFQTEPVEAEALANAKAKYVGDFVLALERPSTVAQYAINTKINELPEDFYATYLEKINAVSIEDVNRVANLYFTADNARIVVVGKGSEVITNLEKTGIPINYFDTFANPVEKPEFTKANSNRCNCCNGARKLYCSHRRS